MQNLTFIWEVSTDFESHVISSSRTDHWKLFNISYHLSHINITHTWRSKFSTCLSNFLQLYCLRLLKLPTASRALRIRVVILPLKYVTVARSILKKYYNDFYMQHLMFSSHNIFYLLFLDEKKILKTYVRFPREP